jgi:hypothetical protein
MTTERPNPPTSNRPELADRERVRAQLEAQRKFRADVFGYVVVNVFLVGVWLFTGAGYFWPGWVLAGWGTLLLLDGWNAYLRAPITDQDIDDRLHRSRR